MPVRRSLQFRQIHLDFHTSPAIPDVGRDFDADAFVGTLKRAHVNSINLFAKCHHGHLYYDTDRPERHPGLPRGLDLLGEQVAACRREGIKTPIYISVQCDEYAANTHPEWVAMEPSGKQVKWGGMFDAGWQILDMSSPYQDYVAEQTAEVLQKFQPVDGLWFDMCWDQPSVSRDAIAGMDRAGLDPEREVDRGLYARQVAHGYMRRLHAMVQASSPGALVFFNGRAYELLEDEIDCYEQIEIEALPTGGWGYMYFPKNVRIARGTGKPYLGVTARFHKSWADFGGIKPAAALEYETAQMVAHGARCSVGDQMHPRGTLDAAAYDLIGSVYARIEEREPWLEGAEAVTQIGVLQGAAPAIGRLSGVDEGVTRMLTQLKQQFDFVSGGRDWGRYELIVLPDSVEVDSSLAQRLEAYLAAGGKVLATGTSGLTADGTAALLPALGVAPEGMSPYTATYVRVGERSGRGMPPTDHIMYERGVRVKAAPGAETLARVVEPYFERTWRHFSSHFQTPGDRLTDYAAAVLNGATAYVAYPLFGAYMQHGNVWMRALVRNLLDLLRLRPLVRVDAPTSTEASVTRQGGRTIVHLLQYCPERRTPTLDLVEDVVPLYRVPLELRLEREPSAVSMAPSREPVAFDWGDGYARVTVPEVRGHAMVVFE